MCRDRRAWFSVPGCFAKQPGKVCRSFSFPSFFFCLLVLTIYLGSLAATQSSQGGLQSAALGRGFRSLAARVAARVAVCGVPRLAGVVFGPWLLCKAARKGYLFLSLPPSFLLFIDTNYLLRLPGCYAKQPGGSTVCHAWRERFSVPGCSRGGQEGGPRCSALGRDGF